MPAQGICFRVTHTGRAGISILITDIEDVTRADADWGQNGNGGYEVKVYVDTVEQTQDPMYGTQQDYSINFVTGNVTFHFIGLIDLSEETPPNA